MEHIDLHYFLHGLITLLVGLIGGYFFAHAIKTQNGKEVAWRVVHSGASVAGIMLIAIGVVVSRLMLSATVHYIVFAGTLLSTYLLVAGMVIAAVAGERGIGKKAQKSFIIWKIVYYFYGIGALISTLSIIYLIVLCYNQL